MKRPWDWMAFATVAVATFVALRAGDASASWRQYSARSNCVITSPTAVGSGGGDEVYNASTTTVLEMACALLESDAFTKSNATAGASELPYTDNYSSGGSTQGESVATAGCVAYASATGGACDILTSSPPGTGSGTLSPDCAVWATGTASDFAYLYVSLPPQYGGSSSGQSAVWGYRFNN